MKSNASYRKILVIKNRAIGDTILLTGVLRLLKQYRPSWEIHTLVSSEAGPLLENLPFIDRIIGVNEPEGKLNRFAFWLKILRRLRSTRYDQVLNFHSSFSTALLSKMMRTELCVVNDHNLTSKNRFSDLPVPGRGKVKSIIDRDLDLLRAIGIVADVNDALPELRPTEFELKRSIELLGPNKAGKRIFLGIGGSRATKKWPAKHFIELAEKMVNQYNPQFILATIASDKVWMEEFQKLLRTKPTLTERIVHFENMSLRTVMALLRHSDFYIGNDSGLKHLAAAVGIPTHTVFGPESPTEWHPYPENKHSYSFIPDLACRVETGKHWCPIENCQLHQHRCLANISPDQVLEKIKKQVN